MLNAPRIISKLTKRELEVLTLIARGFSNAEIAGTLMLSEATIRAHVSSILERLNLRNRVGVVILAYECGLITPAALDEPSDAVAGGFATPARFDAFASP